MKVILINAAFDRYGGIKGRGTMVPLNLCYLAAYARQKHPDAEFKILDADLRSISHEETVEETASFGPDLIGITSNTCAFDLVTVLTSLLKKRLPEVPIIAGGPHLSALPERSLRESKLDFVAIGEGELTFEELIGQLKEGKSDWNKINGLAYRDERGAVTINRPRELIEDLDALPFPARDLIDNALYVPPATKRVSPGVNTLIAASRGCPYNCGFCAAHTVWTRRIRMRKPESIVAEIEECVTRFGVNSIYFSDEFFTASKRRVLEICRLIRERKLRISWVCSARAEKLDRETLEAMRDAGCREISFGIESANSEMLKRIDKAIDLEEAVRVVRLTRKVGIATHASYVLGYIGETEDSIKDTIRFAKRLNTQIAAFLIASPLPGTRLYREAQAKGYLRPDATWLNYSPVSNTRSVLMLPTIGVEGVRKWHRKALRDYYLRPKYILSRLLAIRHWHEVVNLFVGLKIFFRIKK